MKRNTIFGAAALLVAGAAIGAGSVVSQNAMAATDEPAPANELTMVSIDEHGVAIECTFEGADVEGLIPAPPTGVAVDAQPVEGNVVAGNVVAGTVVEGNVVIGIGELVPADGSLPELQVPVGALPVDAPLPLGDGVTGVVSINATAGDSELTIDGVPLEARAGTADECAAMHDDAVAMAASIPTGVAVTGTGGVTITGSAVVSTEAAKP